MEKRWRIGFISTSDSHFRAPHTTENFFGKNDIRSTISSKNEKNPYCLAAYCKSFSSLNFSYR